MQSCKVMVRPQGFQRDAFDVVLEPDTLVPFPHSEGVPGATACYSVPHPLRKGALIHEINFQTIEIQHKQSLFHVIGRAGFREQEIGRGFSVAACNRGTCSRENYKDAFAFHSG